jgi:hypothetical protein
MLHNFEPFSVKVVGFEESREVKVTRNELGRALDLKPVEGSERASLELELPTGFRVRAEVPPAALDEILLPNI